MKRTVSTSELEAKIIAERDSTHACFCGSTTPMCIQTFFLSVNVAWGSENPPPDHFAFRLYANVRRFVASAGLDP